MNKEEKHLLNIYFMYEYYKDNITNRYVRNLSNNIVLDNSCLDIEDLEKIYIIPLKKHQQLQQENQQLKEKLNGVYEERDYLFNKLSFENTQLLNRINKAINNIDILQEIIYQQPTDNQVDDLWLLDKLDGIKNTLKGEIE